MDTAARLLDALVPFALAYMAGKVVQGVAAVWVARVNADAKVREAAARTRT